MNIANIENLKSSYFENIENYWATDNFKTEKNKTV